MLTSQKTKIVTSASEPSSQGLVAEGEPVPRAEKFGDLITADHKVLNEGGESRNNPRYAVVVQDLATQWIQSYPCKTKTSQKTTKVSRAVAQTESHFYWQFSGNSANLVKTCHGIIVKADDAHDRIWTHQDRCRRASKELETAEEDINDWVNLSRTPRGPPTSCRVEFRIVSQTKPATFKQRLILSKCFRGEGPAGERQR